MQKLVAVLLLLLANANAQPDSVERKISPRLRWSGTNVYVVVFKPGAAMGPARQLLQDNHFDVLDHPNLLPNHLLAAGAASALRNLAARDEVAYIMPASVDLVAGNPVIACPGPIVQPSPMAEYVEVGEGWPKDAAGGVVLQYFFQSLTAKLLPSLAQSEIERALREWQKYANISFTPADEGGGSRTLNVLFASGAHGDGYPFDPSGAILAHTFYPAPPNGEPIAGDLHFNADEDWHVGTDLDLFTVALHEAGHALGLGHTDQPGAVMYPYYRMASGLTSDDIAGIQDLYGAPVPATPPPPDPAPSDPAPPTSAPPGPPVTPPSSPVPAPPPPPATPTLPDTTPPSLRIVSPQTTIVLTTSSSFQVSGTAADDRAVAAVKWSTSNGDAGTAMGTTSWSASVPLLIGNTTITVRAYDGAGNSAWRALTVVRK